MGWYILYMLGYYFYMLGYYSYVLGYYYIFRGLVLTFRLKIEFHSYRGPLWGGILYTCWDASLKFWILLLNLGYYS